MPRLRRHKHRRPHPAGEGPGPYGCLLPAAAVPGGPHPHTGAAVVALPVLRAGASGQPDEVTGVRARSLARAWPTSIRVVAGPHSATGRVSRGRLRELQAG